MAERPILKSELAKQAPPEPQTSDRPEPKEKKEFDRDRKDTRGKGRGREDREEKKPPVSAALLRGPKPQPKKEELPEEVISEEEVPETTESEMTGTPEEAPNSD